MRRKVPLILRIVAFACAATAPFALYIDDLFAGPIGLAAVAKMPHYEITVGRDRGDQARVAEEAVAVRENVDRLFRQGLGPARR